MSYIDKRWWRQNEDEIFRAVNKVVDNLALQQTYYNTMDDRHARLYGDMTTLGVTTDPRMAAISILEADRPRLSLNVVKNMCNAVTSKITKNKPRPLFLTSGGSWSEKKKAKLLSKAIEGIFYDTGLYNLAPKIFRDATIFRAGILRICDDGEKIYFERVLPYELTIDDGEAAYGEPRSFYLTKHVDRSVLKELFPEKAEYINSAPRSDAPSWLPHSTHADLVRVREAWHIRSGPIADDGRHVIVIDNATLVDEEFEDDKPPFIFLKWNDRLSGFWGCSLAEELVTIQYEINKTLIKISRCLDLAATPKVLIDTHSKVIDRHITNEIGAIIKYDGTPPQFVTHNSVPPELWNHLNLMYQKAYEITGISQLSAQSQKPAGLNSGIALQTYSDIESERFLTIARQYEEFFLETAKQTIKAIKRLANQKGNYPIKYTDNKTLKWIDWKDIDLEDDSYIMQCYPVNFLASSPSARLSQIQEMMQGGLIGPEEARRLLDYPDLERANSLVTAAYDDIEMLIEKMIEDGEYQSPEPFMNLQLAIQMTQSAYLRARTDGVPEENLELLRQFISDCEALLNQANPPAPPMQDPNMMMDPGMMDPNMMDPNMPLDPAMLEQAIQNPELPIV